MIDFATLATIGAAFVVVASSPGPANLACATVAMSYGRKTAMIFALGLTLGLVFWGLLAALGLGAVLQGSATVLFVLKLCGAFYLLWLAYQSGRSALSTQKQTGPELVAGRWFLRGLILNLSNPKAVFAWMAALSVGLDPNDGLGAVAAATGLCAFIGLLNATGHAWLFSIGGVMAAYRRARHWFDGVAASLFALAGLGLGLIRSAFTR
ncbi:MAG: LysE family translocator [Rhodobacteraceae bacterium]|nr:LysE family translocator [Paracoccaceae bacterium]